jgi:hypothetical protein
MSATVEQATVRVKLTASFAGPGWSADRGDEIEVPLADARRMVARGLARAVDENDRRFRKMTPAELEEARRMAALRSAALEELTANDVRALVRRLHPQALSGDVPAAALLLRYALGRPPEAIDPDTLDLDEWRKLAAMPAYSEVAHVSIDGVVPALAIERISKLKAVEEPFRKEYVGVGQEILAEREARRRRRAR